jgi:hypothetical protein
LIGLATLSLFLLAVLALFLSPGPNMAFVLSHGVAHGPRTSQDWKPALAAELVRDSMRAAQRSPFDPQPADLELFFSPGAGEL